jgi:hypothetical protein
MIFFAANEIANIKMHANIRLLQTHFMIGRPAVAAGSQFYCKASPLSDQGKLASELQLELEYIANRWTHKDFTHGDTNDLDSITTCDCWSNFVLTEQALTEAYKAIWRNLRDDWPSLVGRKLPSSRRPGLFDIASKGCKFLSIFFGTGNDMDKEKKTALYGGFTHPSSCTCSIQILRAHKLLKMRIVKQIQTTNQKLGCKSSELALSRA